MMAIAPSMAQETYDNSPMFGKDLNGTARYVGMGGAMEALGADISTSSTNPAGIGMMRHSSASVSAGIVSQSGSNSSSVDIVNNSTTHVSFDQAGFIYSTQTGRKNFLNFGLNYHKSNNFNQLMYAAAALNGYSSLNKTTYIKGEENAEFKYNSPYSIVDKLNEDAINAGYTSDDYSWVSADGYTFQRNYSGIY